MKLRTIVKIAITSSVVLLCSGFALYSFFRLSAAEDQKDFDLYTLVPSSVSAVFATEDVAEFVMEVDELTCSRDHQYLYVSKLFSYLKQYLYSLLEDAPHGLSRQMNQMLISFHEPDNDRNQVLYCRLGNGDRALIDRFVQKYVSSGYPPKTFDYKGEDIIIYPMADGDFLACYLTEDFLVLSCQKKLIEEVIDIRKTGKSLATDPAFKEVRAPKKSPTVATVYTRLAGMMGWTEFDMKLKDDFIYFSGVSHYVDTCFNFTREGDTVVLITHDNSIAVKADRIVRLQDGKIIYDGDAHDPRAVVRPEEMEQDEPAAGGFSDASPAEQEAGA